MSSNIVDRVHWSFWAIGAAGLVFNCMGCLNYISQVNEEMLASMPDVYRTMVEIRPAWGTGAFALAVFGGALGCLLLLFKKSVAVYVFIASLIGAVAAQIPFFGMADFPFEAWIGWLGQVVVAAFLIWFSKWAQDRGLIS